MKKLLTFYIILSGLLTVQSFAQPGNPPDPDEGYPTPDFMALRALYDNMGGDGWSVKTNWPATNNWPDFAYPEQYATWYGVTVNGTFLNAIELDNNNLSGVIPAELWGAHDLWYFRMPNNAIAGFAQDESLDLNGMYNLYEIDLAHNQISSLPNYFGTLPNLNRLILHHNQIGEIPYTFANHQQLVEVDLSNNNLTDLPDFSASGMLYNLNVANNYLSFAVLENVVNWDIESLTYAPQKTFKNDGPLPLALADPLVLRVSAAPGEFSSVTWEKRQPNGSWISVNHLDEDTDPETFTRNSASESDAGFYRWRMTNSHVPGLTLECELYEVLKASIMNDLVYQYKYDEQGRMTHKKIPGAAWAYLVYDDRDRLVMTQDGNQRNKPAGVPNEWVFTKYDAFNRHVLSGILKDADKLDQAAMQQRVDNFYIAAATNADEWFEARGTSVHGYTNQSFPKVAAADDYLTVTYYDDYDFKNSWSGSYAYVNEGLTGQEGNVTYTQPSVPFMRLLDRMTGTKVKVLNSNTWLASIIYYDDRYRTLQTITDTHLGTQEITTNLYDFNGKILKTKTRVDQQVVTKISEYDPAGRLTKSWHAVNNGPQVLLANNEYNELGQLVKKKLHSTDGNSFKQHVDYRYNILGWLTRINNSDLTPDNAGDPLDHFGINLHYNDVVPGIDNTPQYNGNISATNYSNSQGFDADLKERAYRYEYDALERLTAGTHYEKALNWNISAGLHEDNISYDLNTSITGMSRKGIDGSEMDNLVFSYMGNQLQNVTDSWDIQKGFSDGNTTGVDYTYDANGSRVTDKNKGITSVTYNHMNQRDRVTFDNGNYLMYVYDAAGNKLSQGVYNSANQLQKKTDYVGDFFYENDSLKYISYEEGRYNALASAYEYELRDHLNNNRVTFTTKEELEEDVATMETANIGEEQDRFLRYENVRRVSSHLFDRTNGVAPSTAPGAAVRLNGSTNERYGLARSFAVMPGDVVKAEVYVKYIDTNPGSRTAALNSLLSQIAAGTTPVGTVIDGGSYSSSTLSFPFAGMLNTSGSSGAGPKAYLSWLVFDQNFMMIDGGYKRMSDSPREYGQDCAHEKLSAEIPITKAGFVYVYFSNENESLVDVYYDQFDISLKKSPVINATDLYPYGAPAISYSRERSLKQNRILNGKETQDELGYNVVDLGQRDIDPFVPVFPAIDRYTEKYHSMSPYQYTAGNPVKFIDINGDSLNVDHLRDNNPEANQKLMDDLQAKTGFTLVTDEKGNVTYEKGADGKAKVATKDGKKVGSKAARKALTKVIDSDVRVNVKDKPGGGSRVDMDGPNPNDIGLDSKDIENFMANTSPDLNKTTLGYAITFFHELGHTRYAGAKLDEMHSPQTGVGPNDRLPNKIRKQMGSDYGKRVVYAQVFIKSENKSYMAFSWQTLHRLNAGNVPERRFVIIEDFNKK